MGNETRFEPQSLDFAPVLLKIKKLQSDRSYRDRRKLFFAEGIRNFVQAIDHQVSFETIIYSEKLLISPLARKMVRRLKREGVPFVRTTPEQFRGISQTERASGIAAILHQSIQRLDKIKPDKQMCWTALRHIRSPGNLGTLLRTSAAVGAEGFILIGNEIDPFDPNVVRATMGALFDQKIVRTDIKQFQNWTAFHKLQVVGASPNGTASYDKTQYITPTVLFLGNERSGLTPQEESVCQKLVRIPMKKGTDSLNVAVAGSLLLYEVFRQMGERI